MARLVKYTRRHDIVFHASGRIDIMARIARLLALSKGDVINIESRQGEHYLYVAIRADIAVGKHHGSCYPTHRGGKNFRARSAPLCRKILSLCQGSPPAAGMWCGNPVDLGDGITRIPIITRLNTLEEE